jgi:cephalosporin hydroxylase
MRLDERFKQIALTVGCFVGHPLWTARRLSRLPEVYRAGRFARNWAQATAIAKTVEPGPAADAADVNPLYEYFLAHERGRGIYKWSHYFDIYHRHFARFVGRPVHVLEIGVYSGGSLDMWKHYFGPRCRVTGVDIEPDCRAYEDERTRIFIGDQADRGFWDRVRHESPPIDIVIDDGGHRPEQQMVSVEELLPYLGRGGVYVCEDVHKIANRFGAFAEAVADQLNAFRKMPVDLATTGIASHPTPFQQDVLAVHLYPYAVVIEKTPSPVLELVAHKHGTEWAPFVPMSGQRTGVKTTPG